VPELNVTGTLQPYEKEFFRKDGSRVSVLIGAAMFEEDASQGVAFVLDLTERKEAEAELAARRVEALRAEEQLVALQAELAHATRLTSLGELSASIAHEVGQPLAAIVTTGEACLRWLGNRTPQPEEVRACVELMISEGRRASEIVLRVRSLTKGDAPQKMRLDLNEVLNEVVSAFRCASTSLPNCRPCSAIGSSFSKCSSIWSLTLSRRWPTSATSYANY
jgi:C4-dicarboxylate-specific signal transduction histidine kinase